MSSEYMNQPEAVYFFIVSFHTFVFKEIVTSHWSSVGWLLQSSLLNIVTSQRLLLHRDCYNIKYHKAIIVYF